MSWPKFKHEYPKTPQEIEENGWVNITTDDYYDLLEVLPPIRFEYDGFMVGEPVCHTLTGNVVYLAVIFEPVYRQFWAKLVEGHTFNVEKFQQEILEDRQ